MKRTHQRFVILALNAGNAILEADILLCEGLSVDKYKTVKWMFNGTAKRSYLIPLIEGQAPSLADLEVLAVHHGQSCILVSEDDRSTYLHHVRIGLVEYIGTWHAVPETYAKAEARYTYSEGRYYVAN